MLAVYCNVDVNVPDTVDIGDAKLHRGSAVMVVLAKKRFVECPPSIFHPMQWWMFLPADSPSPLASCLNLKKK